MNTNPTVSRLVERAKITEQPNTRAKANEEGDSYKFSRISLGHYACTHGKNTYIIIDKGGKIGCSCDDMTYRCTDTTVCKHGTKFIDLEVPPQIQAPGELIKKLMLMGWVGGKDDLHPAEMLCPTSESNALPPDEDSWKPDGEEGDDLKEMAHYECPKCGETVDTEAGKLQDWKLNHLDVCTGNHGRETTVSKTETDGTCRKGNILAGSKLAATGNPVPIEPRPEDEPNMTDAIVPPIPIDAPVPMNLATALCNMQKVDLLAVADSKNPFHSAKYADLASVWAAIRKPLTDNGLAVMQTTEPYQNGITVVTTLLHTSGESFTARLSCEVSKSKPDKNGQIKPNIQGLGSTITYLRRYSLIAMVGVAPIDDDGEAAMSR